MAESTSLHKTAAGNFFLVSGLSGGREVFVGRAQDEPFEEHLTLDGKLVRVTPNGHAPRVIVQPFNTRVDFFLLDSSFTVQQVSTDHVQAEVKHFMELSLTQVSPSSFPFLHRWFLATCRYEEDDFHFDFGHPGHIVGEAHGVHHNPLFGFYTAFFSTAEQFRRALFHAKQVSSTRELDKVAELEGDLTVEIGKITNQAAIKFHQIVSQEPELQEHFEAFHGGEFSPAHTAQSMSGFAYLFDRLNFAKSFARRSAKVAVVRDINTLIKDAIFGLNEVILDHANSLDTLITETFSQYGLAYELFGDLSPYAGFTGPAPTHFEHVAGGEKTSPVGSF